MPKTRKAPPTIMLQAPDCMCGQCVVPVYVGPMVEQLFCQWADQIHGVN